MTEPTWTVPLESIATAYAAVIATLALGLEVRRWLKERPKLDITLMPDMVLAHLDGSDADETDEPLVVVSVVNIGGASTAIESLWLVEFTTFARRWLQRPNRAFLANPKSYPNKLPFKLRPNERWTGTISKRLAQVDLETGFFYVQIAASHSKRTTLKRIPRKPKG